MLASVLTLASLDLLCTSFLAVNIARLRLSKVYMKCEYDLENITCEVVHCASKAIVLFLVKDLSFSDEAIVMAHRSQGGSRMQNTLYQRLLSIAAAS